MSSQSDKRILFVDDEENILSAIKRQFHREFRIETALGGEQGLEVISDSEPFPVIVSDLHMNGMNGLDFLRQVREKSPDTICVMLTGFAELDVAVDAVNEGVVFKFLTKPCPPDVLSQTLNECLEQHRRLVAMSVYTYTTHVEDGEPSWTQRSAGCLAVTGCSVQDFAADHLLQFSMVLPDHRGVVKENIKRVIAGNEVGPVEFQIHKKDGTVRWLRDTIIPHRDDDGKVVRFEGLVEDITDQKTVEVALQQSEARYQRMVANLPGLVYQFTLRDDGNVKFIFLSDSCKELFGIDPEKIKDDSGNLMNRFRPEDRGDFFHMIAESAEKLTPCEWRGCGDFDDQEKWFHGVFRPERLSNGDIIWDGVLMDITDYKQIEEEMELLARFSEENPNPVMRVSGAGIITYANKASDPLLRRWDRKANEPLPDNLYDLVTRIKGSGTHEYVEIPCKERVYSIVFASVEDADYVNLYARDITNAKKAEIELIKANEVLKEHDRLKSEFVSTVSHELRTPLCIFKNIVSNAMAGVMGKLSHKLYDSLKMADRSIDRLSRIVGDFLDISKIESGSLKLDVRPMVMQVVASEVVNSLQALAAAKGIEIELSAGEEELVINADQGRVSQMLTNLIGNSIKFIPVNGHIEVKIEDSESEVCVSVKDDGPGLSKEEIDKIFDRFVQIHQISGPGEHGTGLGLTITKELIELHGGRIWVESVLGEGCKFCFALPKDLQAGQPVPQLADITQN